MYLDLCTVNPQPRSGTLNSGRGLAPRIVKLPRIPENGQWQSFLFHAAASPPSEKNTDISVDTESLAFNERYAIQIVTYRNDT
ncbi:hypothetical protein PUG81_28060 [Erwiniaceae bacterium L1_54_6]|jgi:hypothetical protein|nr:hypothetical protein [Erwiniaceae bacterium L1_54_6]